MSSTSTLKQRWTKLLHAAIETCAHQILYQRRVYPANSFTPTRFFGVQCFANRHPGVIKYIQDSVIVTVQTLFSKMMVQVALIILQESNGAEHELERYTIDIALSPDTEWDQEAHSVDVDRLERRMRDFILKVLNVDHGRASSSNSLTFKLVLHRIGAGLTDGGILARDFVSDGDFSVYHYDNNNNAINRSDCFLWDDLDTGLYTLRFGMNRQVIE